MKNHLKRIAAPKAWIINRKIRTFILRPNAGSHKLEFGLALGVILRDLLHLAPTISEVKKIIYDQEILIDGHRCKDHRLLVGLFDVVGIPHSKKYYRCLLDRKGRIIVADISVGESQVKPSKVINKTVLGKNKIQLNLYDGKNIVSSQKVKVGDSLLLSLPTLEIKKVMPLEPGATVFLTKGKHSGSLGILKEIKGDQASYVSKGDVIETAKSYLFVIGGKDAEIEIKNE